jgi:hypothetical protein
MLKQQEKSQMVAMSQRTHDKISLRFESTRFMYMGELAW